MRAELCALAAAAIGCVEATPPAPPVRIPSPVMSRPPPDRVPYVYVRGEVAVPGRYELRTPATTVQVVDAAGGLTRLADTHIVVTRRLDDGRVHRWVVNIEPVRAGTAADEAVVPEDTLDVMARFETPPGVWVWSRPELPPLAFAKPALPPDRPFVFAK